MNRTFLHSLYVVTVFLFLYGCSDSSEDAFLNVDRSELTFTDGNTQLITIDTNEDWIVLSTVPSGTTQWFTVSPTNGVPGEHSISVTPLEANLGTTVRTGNLQIIAGGITRDVELRQNIQANIALSSETVEIPAQGGTSDPVTLTVNSNWTFELIADGSFDVNFSVNPSNSSAPGTYTFTFSAVDANETNNVKTAEFIIRSGGEEATITINQPILSESPFYNNREVVLLQQASTGRGVNLLLMGDGFTQQDMSREGNGRYEQVMNQAMEHFFDVEPFTSYRNYFNVYMMVAISQQAGVGNAPGEINNVFGSYFGEDTSIEFNFDLCREYALEAFQGSNVQEGDITVGIILNSTRYAGITNMQSDGFSIALCPMSNNPAPNDFKGILNHELGGHAFIRAADEYVYSTTQVPAGEIADIRTWQSFGAFLNVDFTNNLSGILWNDFIGLPQYANIGAFEGALTYGRGVWRPEINSCMNNNVPYYNGPSRWMAVERITRIAGNPFTFEQFIENDVIDLNAQNMARTRAHISSTPPLHPPVLRR